ncbi:MAG: ABC transporter permease subunit [Chloroflexi bacterium]|nr:ABC transporter permease subunit [Chloroflexota bacterium]
MEKRKRSPAADLFSLFSNLRFLQALAQAVFLLSIVLLLAALVNAIIGSLQSKNITPSFNFLNDPAGFEIGGAQDYTPEDTFWQAFMVGVGNTFRVIIIGLALTTVLGVFVGICLLSTNWLVRTISWVYVEILRNTPLLVQLFFWYFGVMLALPRIQQALALPPEGVLLVPLRTALWAALLAYLWWFLRQRRIEERWHAALLPAALVMIASCEVLLRLGGLSGGALLLLLALAVGALLALRSLAAVPPALAGMSVGLVGGAALVSFGLLPAGTLLRLEIFPLLYISNRGMVIPELLPTARFAEWLAFVVLGLIAASGVWIYAGNITENTGRKIPRALYATLLILGLTLAGWWFVGLEPQPESVPVTTADGTTLNLALAAAREQNLLTPAQRLQYSSAPLEFVQPVLQGARLLSGANLQAQYVAILLALVIYTSAFIAEIVRAGILAVPYGQVEAARALGLSYSQILQLVILPQALRVIIPPLGNQYLNLSKNSSLAIAVAFADAVQVMQTIMNQSGQSVPGIILLMIFYLLISLSIALAMNWLNRRFQLVTR